MLSKPPEPHLGSIDGDTYRSLAPYLVDFSDWLDELEFIIYPETPTDIASVPWFARWLYDRASLGLSAPFIHDFLSTTRGRFTNTRGREIQLSWFATQVFFLVVMVIDRIPVRRAFLAFLAVVLFNRPKW